MVYEIEEVKDILESVAKTENVISFEGGVLTVDLKSMAQKIISELKDSILDGSLGDNPSDIADSISEENIFEYSAHELEEALFFVLVDELYKR